MALTERTAPGSLTPIVDAIAGAIGRHGMKPGNATGAKAALRVTFEESVRRMVQVYWTPFEANVPGPCVGLHLEVAEPRVHWAEAYLSNDHLNWVFCFYERADGEVQLAYYQEYADAKDAIRGFFNLSTWYVLTATDTAWADVVYEVDDALPWGEHHQGIAGEATPAAISESLKKSSILWLRWTGPQGERSMPVWFLYDQKVERIYVISGERSQTIPDARSLREVDVVLRWKGKNSAVAELPASVRVIDGADPQWDELADRIAEKRLNIPGLPEDTARRWREDCVILELTLRR